MMQWCMRVPAAHSSRDCLQGLQAAPHREHAANDHGLLPVGERAGHALLVACCQVGLQVLVQVDVCDELAAGLVLRARPHPEL